MMRLARISSYSLLMIALISASGCMKESASGAITKEDAETFLSSYASTLKSGDTQAIKEYWSSRSFNRKGFDVMYLWVRGLIHIRDWKSFFDSTQYSYEIKELLDKDGYTGRDMKRIILCSSLTFSLPIGLAGEPQDQWRYFVGVGLTNEAAFNFSGLVPVFQSIAGLISGGNYDHSDPGFIDILLPEDIDQSGMLSDYDPEKGKLAAVKMVSATGEGF